MKINNMKTLWVDDQPRRKERASKLNINFLSVEGLNLNEVITEIKRSKSLDLIILDHFLEKMSTSGSGLSAGLTKGSTIAQIIREHWPCCPIVGVSAAERIKDINKQGQKIYDEIYELSDFTRDKIDSLESIASGFNVLKGATISKKDHIVTLLNVPEGEEEIVKNVMPDFLDGNGKNGVVHEIAYWIRYKLLLRPGILYDNMWAATLLGVNVKHFSEIEKLIKPALYKGIFSDTNSPRWWGSLIRYIAYKKFKNLNRTYELADNDKNIKSAHYSICHVCKKQFPEVVGYTDEEYKTRKPMHLRCTVSDKNRRKSMYFEETRIMNG